MERSDSPGPSSFKGYPSSLAPERGTAQNKTSRECEVRDKQAPATTSEDNWKRLRAHIISPNVSSPLSLKDDARQPATPNYAGKATDSSRTLPYGFRPLNASVSKSDSSSTGAKSSRFKNTVQQTSDMYKMSRELDRIFASYVRKDQPNEGSEGIWIPIPFSHSTGNAIATITDQAKKLGATRKRSDSDQRYRSNSQELFSKRASTGLSHLMDGNPFLRDLADCLNRWSGVVVKVPDLQGILAALARVFQKPPVNVADCHEALNIFLFLRDNYGPFDLTDRLAQTIWCASLLSVKYVALRPRIWEILEDFFSSDNDFTLPLHRLDEGALHSLIYTLVHTLAHLTERKQETTAEEAFRLKDKITTLIDMILTSSFEPSSEDLANLLPQQKWEALAACLASRDGAVRSCTLSLLQKLYPRLKSTDRDAATSNLLVFARTSVEHGYALANEDRFDFPESGNTVLSMVNQTSPANMLQNLGSVAISSMIFLSLACLTCKNTEQSQNGRGTSNGEKNGADNTAAPISNSSEFAKDFLHAAWQQGRSEQITAVAQEFLQFNLVHIVTLYEMVLTELDTGLQNAIFGTLTDPLFKMLMTQRPKGTPRISRLLQTLARAFPSIFYRSLMACVTSNDHAFIAEQLVLFRCLQSYLSRVRLWMTDPDMMCVILLTDVNQLMPGQATETNDRLEWGSYSLGQLAATAEFLYVIKALHTDIAQDMRTMEEHEMAKKFLIDLERKLAIYLASKEQKRLLSHPIRVLIVNIFREIRFLCRTVHRPAWLLHLLEWLVQYTGKSSEMAKPEMLIALQSINLKTRTTARQGYQDSIDSAYEHLEIIYGKCDDVSRNLDNSDSGNEKETASLSKIFKEQQLNEAQMQIVPCLLSLLVAVHTTISPDEISILASMLWENFLEFDQRPEYFSAAFLFLHCGDKSPTKMMQRMNHDLEGLDLPTRVKAVHKIATLFGHRYDIYAQPVIADSSTRRPFRVAAINTTYVPTDLGANEFNASDWQPTHQLDGKESIPVEMKRQIQALGWETDEDMTELNAVERTITPLHILPTFYVDEQVEKKEQDPATAKQAGATASRRPMTLPALSVAALSLTDLLKDPESDIFNLVRETIMNILRDDAVLFLRVIFGEIGKAKSEKQQEMISRLRLLLGLDNRFPPAFSRLVYNHIAGYLKWLAREANVDALPRIAHAHPLLVDIIPSTSEISVRDMRKHKVEYLVAATGQFQIASEHQQITKHLSDSSHMIMKYDAAIFNIAIYRISQIRFLTNYLRRFPREVYAVKKTFKQFEAIPQGQQEANMSKQQADQDTHDETSTDNRTLAALHARTWLQLVDSLITNLNGNYNDRNELAYIFKGVNQILISHRLDSQIVGSCILIYVRATQRFRRLFNSNLGYSTFISSLFRLFTLCSSNEHLRNTIIHAWKSFYSSHQESFVFQMLGDIVPIVLQAHSSSAATGDKFAHDLYLLLRALSISSALLTEHDRFGVVSDEKIIPRDQATAQPVDAHQTAPTVKPSFFPSLAGTATPAHNHSTTEALLPVANISSYFSLEDSVKLYLTIIAYDPGSVRAEQFCNIFCYQLRYLMNDRANVRQVVDDGVAALIEVFNKFARSIRQTNLASTDLPFVSEDEDKGFFTSSIVFRFAEQRKGKPWPQNDRILIKRSFLRLTQEYIRCGGSLADSKQQKLTSIFKYTLRDLAAGNLHDDSDLAWARDFISYIRATRTTEITQSGTAVEAVLDTLVAFLQQHWRSVDVADVFSSLAQMFKESLDETLSSVEFAFNVRSKFVPFGLSIATSTDWQDEVKQQAFADALVELIVILLESADQDVFREIEARTPTASMLRWVIIPLCLRYDLRCEFRSVKTFAVGSRDDRKYVWTRLAAYVSRAFRKASFFRNDVSISPDENGPGDDQGASFKAAHKFPRNAAERALLTLAFGFTAIKVIIIRGLSAIEVDSTFWLTLSRVTKTALINAKDIQQVTSRSTQSPTSASPTRFGAMPVSPRNLGFSYIDRSTAAFNYTLWSFLEFVIACKSPLFPYLRTFVHECIQSAYTSGSHVVLGRSPELSHPRHVSALEAKNTSWMSWGGPTPFAKKSPFATSSYSDSDYLQRASSFASFRQEKSQDSTAPQQLLEKISTEAFHHVLAFLGYRGSVGLASSSDSTKRLWDHHEALRKQSEEWHLLSTVWSENEPDITGSGVELNQAEQHAQTDVKTDQPDPTDTGQTIKLHPFFANPEAKTERQPYLAPPHCAALVEQPLGNGKQRKLAPIFKSLTKTPSNVSTTESCPSPTCFQIESSRMPPKALRWPDLLPQAQSFHDLHAATETLNAHMSVPSRFTTNRHGRERERNPLLVDRNVETRCFSDMARFRIATSQGSKTPEPCIRESQLTSLYENLESWFIRHEGTKALPPSCQRLWHELNNGRISFRHRSNPKPGRQWVNEYAPSKSDDVLGNVSLVHDLATWLKEIKVDQGNKQEQSSIHEEHHWDYFSEDDGGESVVQDDADHDEDFQQPSRRKKRRKIFDSNALNISTIPNVIILTGPTGSCKTAAIYAVASELGYETFELNSGQRRSGKDLLAMVGDMARNHLVSFNKPSAADPSSMSTLQQFLNNQLKIMVDHERHSPSPSSTTPDPNSSQHSRQTIAKRKEVKKKPIKLDPKQTSIRSLFSSTSNVSSVSASSEATNPQSEEAATDEVHVHDDIDAESPKSAQVASSSGESETDIDIVGGDPVSQWLQYIQTPGPIRQSLILLEDVDIMFDEDRNFWQTLAAFARKSRRPIILTCNDLSKIPTTEFRLRDILNFSIPPDHEAVAYLHLIALLNGIYVPLQDLQIFWAACGRDIRRAIHALQFHLPNKQISFRTLKATTNDTLSCYLPPSDWLNNILSIGQPYSEDTAGLSRTVAVDIFLQDVEAAFGHSDNDAPFPDPLSILSDCVLVQQKVASEHVENQEELFIQLGTAMDAISLCDVYHQNAKQLLCEGADPENHPAETDDSHGGEDVDLTSALQWQNKDSEVARYYRSLALSPLMPTCEEDVKVLVESMVRSDLPASPEYIEMHQRWMDLCTQIEPLLTWRAIFLDMQKVAISEYYPFVRSLIRADKEASQSDESVRGRRLRSRKSYFPSLDDALVNYWQRPVFR
ncbi:hypothetical protein BZG36_00470 [Bifiguratus adelaidae]|uniref:AAA+ ATPase domain-containing protein n=1 Tax=Bifiguratus adelaidae TaxID=1938954 RepID=A0A261Y7C6_9FUNG|nr:hypothetical protein BZG36_00470 [Bifiguratus adelaidae]